MNKEQINFLENLKEEILTQDNLSTRDVMFAVLETKRQFNIDRDCCNDEVLIIDDIVCDNINEVIDYFPNLEEELKELDLEAACYLLNDYGYDARMSGTIETKEFNFHNGQSVFFTSKACKEFIKNNKHNLSLPICYGISSWNNPEMNKLREIIVSTDWKKLDEPKKHLNREVYEFNSMTPKDALEELKSWDFYEAFGDDAERLSDAIKRLELLVREVSE